MVGYKREKKTLSYVYSTFIAHSAELWLFSTVNQLIWDFFCNPYKTFC